MEACCGPTKKTNKIIKYQILSPKIISYIASRLNYSLPVCSFPLRLLSLVTIGCWMIIQS